MSQIADVRVEPLDLPLAEPFEISLGTQYEASNVLVRLETDEGVVGYGEGSPLPPVTGETQSAAIATAEAAAELLVGTDLTDYRARVEQLRTTFPGMATANFAIETAILDAFCRERGLALAELFGGQPTTVTTDLTVPILPPDEAQTTAERAAEAGFDHLKIKTGKDVGSDVERVLAVHEGAPDARLKVDANQGWTPKETLSFASAIADRDVTLDLIEQPVPKNDVAGLARTRDRVDLPIAADESVFTPTDAITVVRADGADVLNVKLGKCGPLAVADIVSIARAADLELMIGCMLESAIGIHTSAHLVAGTDAFSYVDLDGNQLLAEDVVEGTDGPSIEPSGPGHGVVPE